MATRDEILTDYNTDLARIDGRRELSAQARQVAQARAFRKAHNALQDIATEQETAVSNRRRELERTMFGATSTDPSAALSRRDAADRAALIEDPAEAMALLKRSDRAGDEALAQAIAARGADLAREPKWGAVVDAYTATRPKAAEAMSELLQLPDFADPITKIRHAAEHMVAAPAEIGALQPHRIEALADSDLLPDEAA